MDDLYSIYNQVKNAKSIETNIIHTKIPTLSSEQNNIVEQLENSNVIVDSVAGSGKTTTNLHIALKYSTYNILLLTYNAKLKIETRDRVKKFNIKNLEVHNYHSFCCKYYDSSCFNDTKLKGVISERKKSIKQNKFAFDMIILDEAQDINPLYYELFYLIYKENSKNAKICILGDRYQSIYAFNEADERFIIHADKLFNFNTSPWTNLKLSYSFRITHEMCLFINKCMLNEDRMFSNKISNNKPRYIICDTFGDKLGSGTRTFDEVKYYLEKGYSYSDFFILAPSVKSIKSPIRQLANELSNNKIPIYVPISDEEKIDEDIIKDKMVFSTFHQVKGLERKIVIIFNFDNSYFLFYNRGVSPKVTPNELYVAVTRGLEHLTVFHHYQNDYLPFLNILKLKEYCYYEKHDQLKIFESNMNKNVDTSVTDIIKHLPTEVIQKSLSFFTIKKIKNKQKDEYNDNTKLSIPSKTKQKYGYETVSEITGVAIPSLFEYKIKNKMSILDELRLKTYTNVTEQVDLNISQFRDSNDTNDSEEKYDLHKIDLSKITEQELLYIANRWNSYTSGYVFKVNQINNYDWLSKENLDICIDRLKNIKISKNAIFEHKMSKEEKPELLNRRINGFIDCIDGNKIYEFKCVSQVEAEHFLQLAIYMYLIEVDKIIDVNVLSNDAILKSKQNLKEGDQISYRDEYNILREGYIIQTLYKNGKVKLLKSETITRDKIVKNITWLEKNPVQLITEYKYYLYNILSNDLYEIKSDKQMLINMMEYLIYCKYVNVKKLTDDEFIEKIKKLIN